MARLHKVQGTTYPYWKPKVCIHLIQDDEGYPLEYANRLTPARYRLLSHLSQMLEAQANWGFEF